ncbi:hypothetical protein ACQPXM_41170 (plasmid) [Kribbella sp. CA-253562]|uniref:hypothetical protein n=1 Tax=Kribbella sp. CA-253562 TaxID=3239942 RepID=UPI003D91566D
MRQGRTLTKHLNLETRQYDILGLDLNEGAPRRQVALTAVSFVIWCLLMAPIVGLPGRWEAAIYIVPPMVFAWFAWQKSPTHDGRRRRLTDWLLQLRYTVSGHRPVISLGSRQPTSAELIPLRERIAFDAVWQVLDFRQGPRTSWGRTKSHTKLERRPASAPVEIYQTVRLFDADQIAAARDSTVRKLTKQRRDLPQGA